MESVYRVAPAAVGPSIRLAYLVAWSSIRLAYVDGRLAYVDGLTDPQ